MASVNRRGDYQNVQREKEGSLDKLTHIFRSPDIKRFGIELDISIRGQVCDANNCQLVDVAIRVPCQQSQETSVKKKLDLKQLVRVRTNSKPDTAALVPKQLN